jgi:hypothetical protein
MLATECPSGYSLLLNLTENVRDEFITYVPPTWDLHDEYINNTYPPAVYHELAVYTVLGLSDKPRSKHEQMILDISGYPKDSITFKLADVMKAIGIPASQMRSVLAKSFRGFVRHYSIFLPTDPDADYSEFIPLPDGTLAIRRLSYREDVKYISTIYVVKRGWKDPCYWIIDALSNGRRGDWYKMKGVIENAEIY